MKMLRILFSIAFPASAAAYLWLIGSMTIEAIETLDVRKLWSTDLIYEHPIEHLAIPVLALIIAGCVGWFRLQENKMKWIERVIFARTIDLAAVGMFTYAFCMMFTFIALPLIALGTLTGLIIIVSLAIAAGTTMFLVG